MENNDLSKHNVYRRLILASRLCGALAIALEAIADALRWQNGKDARAIPTKLSSEVEEQFNTL